MKTSQQLRKLVFDIINVTSVTSLIDGDISYLKMPVDNDKTNIIINSLPLDNNFTQNGVVNVNVYVPLLAQAGMPDINKIETINAALVALLDIDRANGDSFFQFEIIAQSDFQDLQLTNYTVSNFRLNCWLENDTTRNEV